MIIVFECSENCNKYKEEIEFNEDTTEEEIQEAFVDWVWQQVGDYYSWRVKETQE